MLLSVTAVEEVREAILKPPTVEDVHMYPLQDIQCENSVASLITSNDRKIKIKYGLIIYKTKDKILKSNSISN